MHRPREVEEEQRDASEEHYRQCQSYFSQHSLSFILYNNVNNVFVFTLLANAELMHCVPHSNAKILHFSENDLNYFTEFSINISEKFGIVVDISYFCIRKAEKI